MRTDHTTTDSLASTTWQYVNSSAVAAEYDATYANTPLFEFDTAVIAEAAQGAQSILDLGCGTGRHVIAFAKRGMKAVGVDLSPHMLALAQAKARSEPCRVSLVQANIADLGFLRDDTFDCAVSMFSTIGLIQGRTGRRHFLREVRRVLRPSGAFVCHVHNRYRKCLDSGGLGWLFGTYLSALCGEGEPGDTTFECHGIRDLRLHLFTRRELERLVRDAGFEVERLIALNPRRDGEMPRRIGCSLRANGFIVVARNGVRPETRV